jgi:UDP-N-acetyl-D-mannosaminouronate:lipid I N-acetyl-D-mannosaminouronosyltransferase
MRKQTVIINGVQIYPFTFVDELLDMIAEKKILIAINGGKIYHATDDTRCIINNNIGYIDGAGALFAVKRKGFKSAVKIAGCDLWLELIKRYYQNKSFYLIGGKQEVIVETVQKLKLEFPAINIINYRNGYLSSDNERELLIKDIIAKKPDIIFIAMGSPKQEYLMQEFYNQYPAIYQGLGGSFDLYTGRSKRAPKWLIDRNMEGTYRFLSNFSYTRLKRYLNDIIFVVKVFFNFY